MVQASNSGVSRINFHGSFAAATKVINAKDVGLAKGDAIYLQSITLEGISDKPTIASVSLVDIFGPGEEAEKFGPRSTNHLCNAAAKFQMSFRNPNPRYFSQVTSPEDDLVMIYNSDASAKLTFAGTLYVQRQGSDSKQIS